MFKSTLWTEVDNGLTSDVPEGLKANVVTDTIYSAILTPQKEIQRPLADSTRRVELHYLQDGANPFI